MQFDITTIRAQFPILARSVNNHPLAYLDTAASAQKPLAVLDAMNRVATTGYANIKRSAHDLAERATASFEEARNTVAMFLNARADEIVFTSGTTDGLNKVARMLEPRLHKGDELVVGIMEHHSNFVPWQQLAKRTGAVLRIIPLTPDYLIDMEAFEKLLSHKTKIVAAAHVSNVLGTINPIADMASLLRTHAPNAAFVVDGAQAVAHVPVDMRTLDCDFYAFSGHKLYGPTGIGVLYGRHNLLRDLEPGAWGGEMVGEVTVEHTTWVEPPARFEPGTPNILGAIGLAAAIRWIRSFGWDAIQAHEKELIEHALSRLSRIPGLVIIGSESAENRGGAISFTLSDWHPHDLADVLNANGIAVRSGHHCTQPLHCALGIDASTRASIAIHTTKEEIDRLADTLEAAASKDVVDPSTVFEGEMTQEQRVIRDDIMDHALHPRNRRIIEGIVPVLGKNPNCGDTVEVYAVVRDGKVTDLSFQGKGCAISQAAMSKLTKALVGKNTAEIDRLSMTFINKLLGLDFTTKPVRARCAMLGLRAAQAAIKKSEDTHAAHA